jgi:hypothetical protein
MEKTKTNYEERLRQMKEDYNTEWWKPGKIDNYDLRTKVN